MFRAFLRAPSGIASLLVIVAIILVATIAPATLTGAADKLDLGAQNDPPSAVHLLGTDALGRDVLARVLVATRISVLLSLGAVALGAVLGLSVGLMAPLMGRRLRAIVLRTIDSLISFPLLLVALFVSTILGSGALSAMVGIGIGTSFSFARVSSALALTVGGREFILAARALGLSGVRRMWRYVLPNVAETLLISTTVAISSAIAVLSTLSFLGLGVQAPLYDWGSLLTEGVKGIFVAPAAAVGPALAIMLAALAFGFAGEALARATNPLLWATRGAATRASRTGGAPEAALAAPGRAIRRDRTDKELQVPAADSECVPPILDVHELTVAFPGSGRPLEAVSKVSFSLGKGERLGIVGESGSGKTMLAMAIADLLPGAARCDGRLALDGRPLDQLTPAQRAKHLGQSLAVVFQDPMSSLNPALRIGTQLAESPMVNRGLDAREAQRVAVERLREVRMPVPERQMDRYPHELSGGMRQRVMIAMALMNQPPLLIADEPTTALDVTIQAQIIDLLRNITAKHGTSIILISHNLALVGQFCDRVLVMYAGSVVEELTTVQLLTRPLHPYTVGLLGAVPDLARTRGDRFTFIPGTQPDLASRPAGCRYHPRCSLATERCSREEPPLTRRADGRRLACWVVQDSPSP